MLVNAYADESGTGGESRIILAAMVQFAHKWHRFNSRWDALLKRRNAPYFHLRSMRNREAPFTDWGGRRTGAFIKEAAPLIEDNVAFGVTVAVDHDLFKTEYRDKLHPGAHKDSAYGVCARILIETTTLLARQFWGEETVANFVFETSGHFGEVERIFRDAKHHIHELAQHLGKVSAGEKDEFCGLQAADLHASVGRRWVRDPKDRITTPFKTLGEARKAANGCPMFHYVLDKERLPEIREQSESISREKKWAARAKGFERRKARADLR